MATENTVLSWVHFGDLHMTIAGERNHQDFLELIDAANRHLAGAVDFAVLPGDNADNGAEEQFRIVRKATTRLGIPLHILPGDHDFQPRNLTAFYAVLGAERLPKAHRVAGCRCLFLDVVSGGTGGPDFRLPPDQLAWLQRELGEADAAGERSVVFMHTYPADLQEGAEALLGLLARHRVACVDTGHTHYNELTNDGRTIFAATRSTGQIEEGPVGFSMAAVDGSVVSWRFKPLAESWPFVLITSPADERLVTDPGEPDQIVRQDAPFEVRAKAWSGRGIREAACRINGGEWRPMSVVEDHRGLWRGEAWAPRQGNFALTVRAEASDGNAGEETIRVAVAGGYIPPRRHADGSDKDALGAWPEKGILGTRLGPNRNGKKW
jgi:hypothetical protein